jgi:predicted phosphoadenosine phosphosulfate sulfurtransferase
MGKAPSWRKVAKSILRNDYWCRWLGFSPTKTTAYQRYTELMRRRRKEWQILDTEAVA